MGYPTVKNFFTSEQYKRNCRVRKSPFSQKHRTLMAKYGIGEDEYNFMLAFQNNACGIARHRNLSLSEQCLLIIATKRAAFAVCCALAAIQALGCLRIRES